MVLNDICEFIVDCPHSTAPNEGEGYPIKEHQMLEEDD